MEIMNRSDLSQGSGCGFERQKSRRKNIDNNGDLKNEC